MENSGIFLLVVSSAISFGLGRLFLHLRNKKRWEKAQLLQARQAEAAQNQPIGPESKNRSKRKRQLQQLEKQQVRQGL